MESKQECGSPIRCLRCTFAEAQQSWPQGAGTALYADRDKIGIGGAPTWRWRWRLDRSDTRLASLLAEVRDAAIVFVIGGTLGGSRR